MDRLEAMSLLTKVVDTGSFSAASRETGIPLASVSRKIGELETHLGTKLLLRTTRKVSLTVAGEAYVAAARRILDDVGSAERAAAGEFEAPRGELMVAAPVMFGRLIVLPIVIDFLKAFPDISVRLTFSDRNAQIVEEHVDVAVRIGALPSSGMIATSVGTMRTVVCASPALLSKHRPVERPEDLEALPAVAFEFRSPVASWRFREPTTRSVFEVPVSARLSVTTAEAAVFAASEAIGVTRVFHYQCAEAAADDRLRIVLPEFELDPAPVSLVHAQGGLLPLKIRTFLDFAAPHLRQRLQGLNRGHPIGDPGIRA